MRRTILSFSFILFLVSVSPAHAEFESFSCGEVMAGNPRTLTPETQADMQQAVLKYGATAFSFDVFEKPTNYRWFPFAGKHGQGGIAYKVAFLTRVIVGDPLLAPEDWAEAMNAFLATRRPFMATMATFASERFAKVALETEGAAIEAQNAVSLNPQEWQTVGPKTGQIRTCVRKCNNLGLVLVKMKYQKEPEPWFRQAAQNLISDWQNSLKQDGNVHEVNLWDASEYKQYFALMDPETGVFHAMVVARPLNARQGFFMWSARASYCVNGSLEATIAGAVASMREDGVTYLTFGPFQAARPHVYINESGGTALGRYILGTLVPAYIKKAGFDQTMNYFKKFNFDTSENIYNLIWPRNAWIRPYSAMDRLFHAKRKKAEF